MKTITVCENNKCVGCMACIDICPNHAITIKDSLTAYNAVIDTSKCIECGLCHNICQNNQAITYSLPISWVQGWISDEQLRANSSSGGAARALSESFISSGGLVCSCCFYMGEFVFQFAETKQDLSRFTGSKYVKSNPSGIYKQIKQLLREGRKVLFIGLPCQVSALKIYVGEAFSETLYTVDLICHGTPSPNLLNDYLMQHNSSLRGASDVSFRQKTTYSLRKDHVPVSHPGTVDHYLLAFLCGLNYTENCYACKYASLNRTSDITIGDSWGSDLEDSEKQKGISLILCQTAKGQALIDASPLTLHPVDLNRTLSTNEQLRKPVDKTPRYSRFWKHYRSGNFSHAVWMSLPRKCFNQLIKYVLIQLKLYK